MELDELHIGIVCLPGDCRAVDGGYYVYILCTARVSVTFKSYLAYFTLPVKRYVKMGN